jgi:hypothetical protein
MIVDRDDLYGDYSQPEVRISKIPKGLYCYDERGVCPYWGRDTTKEQQESGYCALLGINDWESFGLLWDQVKECNINMDEFNC